MPNRLATLICLLLLAVPAWAHGEGLLVAILALRFLPGCFLLLVPWHAWWARVLATALFAAATVLLWSAVLPRLDEIPMSAPAEWALLSSPSLLGFAAALLLRRVAPRATAP